MRKRIKKWGNASGILLSREDLELYGLKIGDIVDLEFVKVNKSIQKKKPVKKGKGFLAALDDVIGKIEKNTCAEWKNFVENQKNKGGEKK